MDPLTIMSLMGLFKNGYDAISGTMEQKKQQEAAIKAARDYMSWHEARGEARTQLDPRFSASLKQALATADQSALSRGMYGQTIHGGMLTDATAQNELAKQAAIAALSGDMRSQSISAANSLAGLYQNAAGAAGQRAQQGMQGLTGMATQYLGDNSASIDNQMSGVWGGLGDWLRGGLGRKTDISGLVNPVTPEITGMYGAGSRTPAPVTPMTQPMGSGYPRPPARKPAGYPQPMQTQYIRPGYGYK